MRESNEEKINRRNNYIKKPVWIYVESINNGTDVLCATINRKIQRKEKKLDNGFYRFENV